MADQILAQKNFPKTDCEFDFDDPVLCRQLFDAIHAETEQEERKINALLSRLWQTTAS